MCGISGILTLGADVQPLPAAIERMIDAQHHRGPDARGSYYDRENGCALGHNRLSIIDLSPTGAQPMSNVGERQIICFNGEVYNFPELRRELESVRSFAGRSDTEVVLAAYERWGTASFERLNGMFAFALLDRQAQRLFLVRDRLGIKPLYLAKGDGYLVFSSEIGGILASKLVSSTTDLRWLHEYLYFGNTLGSHTFYEAIEQLPPGCYLEVDLATHTLERPRRYWSVAALVPAAPPREAEAVRTTRHLLDSAIKRQLTSDVPVGAFLSGGIDSSAVVALASKHYGGKLRTYTVGFDYIGDGEELPQARRVAQLCGTEHHELHVSGRNIEDVIERMADAHGQPFADPANLPLFQLCQALGGKTKVILQGDGGDELFGGYRRYVYQRTPAFWGPFAKAAQMGLAGLRGRCGKRAFGAHRFFHALARDDEAQRMGLLLTVEGPLNPPTAILNVELRAEIAAQDPLARYSEVLHALPPGPELQRMLHADLEILLPDIFLPKVDRSTMATSTEVRVPFLDFELVDYVAALPSSLKVGIGQRKKLLRKVLSDIVPRDILNAPKKGFGVPIAAWLAGPLRDFAQGRILAQAGPGNWFDAAAVTCLFDDHASGRRDHAQLLWKALQLALWRERMPSTSA